MDMGVFVVGALVCVVFAFVLLGDALEGFRLYGEMHRFIPVFADSIGAKITELPVHHHARKFGKAKYGLERTIKVILDLFTVKFLLDYSHKPMRLFGGAGITLMFFSFVMLLALFVRKLVEGVPILTSPIVSLGVNVLHSRFPVHSHGPDRGIVSPHVSRVAKEPTYTIRQILGK